MTTPIGSFQGLASGIQWRDLVDQLIAVDTARALGPLTRERAQLTARADGWTGLGALAGRVRDALTPLADGSAFGRLSASVPNSPTTNQALVGVSALSGAQPGRYRVESLQLASAERLSGTAVADPSEALGISGEFVVAGVGIAVGLSDSLETVRDKLNAANRGATPSRVSASIQVVGGLSRLVLASDRTGATGIELAEVGGGASLLEALGLVDGTRVLNARGDGTVHSMRMASATTAVVTALGLTGGPPSAAIRVNGRDIAVDLSADSLSDVVARINAVTPGAARLATESDGSGTWSRLVVAGGLATDGSAASQQVLETLGLSVGGRASDVPQRLSFGTTLTGAGGAPATAVTSLADLGVAGSAVGLQAGDVIRMVGTDGAGGAVAVTYTVTGSDAVGDLLGALQGAFSGRAATVAIIDGHITVTDGTAGVSRLAVGLSAGLQGGTTLDFGGVSTEQGRARRLSVGADAQARVDGVLVTGATNALAGAVGGAQLNLQVADPGTVLDVNITAEPASATAAVQSLVSAYNELRRAISQETASAGRLPFSSSARAVLGALNGVLLGDVAGLPSGSRYLRAGSVGLQLQKDGSLSLDEAAFRAAVGADPTAVRALFETAGRSDDASVAFVSAPQGTPAGTYALAVSQAATRGAVTGTILAAYAAAAAPATMRVTDDRSGREVAVQLRAGESATLLAARLQAAFDAERLGVVADAPGGALRLTSSGYGSASTFRVAYDDPGGELPATQVGIPAGTHGAGLDASATLDGEAMTGDGQLLTSAGGFTVRYAGTANLVSTTVRYAVGVGGALQRQLESVLLPGAGLVASQTDAVSARLAALTTREAQTVARLDRRRAVLLEQFSRMEAALSQLQGQGQWLAGQVAALRGLSPARD